MQLDWTCLPGSRGDMKLFNHRIVLMENTKRAIYQAICIWSQTTIRQMKVQRPGDRRWKKQSDSLQIVLMTLPAIANNCQMITKCGYKTEYHDKCKHYLMVCHEQLWVVASARTDLRVEWMDPIQHRIFYTNNFFLIFDIFCRK